MANVISIAGKSGAGKSTSIQYLDPKETFIIAVTKKDLPFSGTSTLYTRYNAKTNPNGNYYTTHRAADIIKLLSVINKRKEIKNLILDDIQYNMAKQAMERAKEKNFDKHTDIAADYSSIIEKALALRDDLFVFTLSHVDEEVNKETGDVKFAKIKTLGKMLDNVMSIDGLYTWNIWCEKLVDYDDEGNEATYHVFKTNDPTGRSTCKTPHGAFEDMYIPNSLQLVIDAITQYKNKPVEKAPLTKIPSSLNKKMSGVQPEKPIVEKMEEVDEEIKEELNEDLVDNDSVDQEEEERL